MFLQIFRMDDILFVKMHKVFLCILLDVDMHKMQGATMRFVWIRKDTLHLLKCCKFLRVLAPKSGRKGRTEIP